MTIKQDIKALQSIDGDHHLHPFTDFKELKENGTRIVDRAEGCYIYEVGGDKILDGMAGLWTNALGYSQPKIVDAVTEQLKQLPYYNSFFQCTNPPAIELSKLLADVAPAHMNNVFFTCSGSEANDTNLRMINRYWQLQGEPQRKAIISRKNAYHGSTIAGASLGGMGGMHSQLNAHALPNIHHIQQPHFYNEGADMTEEEFGLFAARELEKKIEELGPENVAAFIGEPVQGAGGVIVPPSNYWPEIQRICDKHGILIVADEVICAFGRTGEWFASPAFGIKPDLITFAKAVTSGFQPLGGVMVGDRIASVLKTEGGEFGHGYTYSGHPAACAAAITTLKIMRDEGVIDYVKNDIGPYFQEQMRTLSDHPLVGEVRGMGLFAAIELVKNKETKERFDSENGSTGGRCRDYCTQNGLIMRAVGEAMITAPPLIITRDQVDDLVSKARLSLDQTAQDLGVS